MVSAISFPLLILAVVQVPGVVSMSQLPSLLGSVQEELDNSEWTVKKAAAETLSNMATAVGGVLGSYRGSVLATLENNRFDKVNIASFSASLNLQRYVLSRVFYYLRCTHSLCKFLIEYTERGIIFYSIMAIKILNNSLSFRASPLVGSIRI